MNPNKLQAGLALMLAGCALALPMRAGAEETKVLYKCVDAKGLSTIQGKSCPPGSTQVWARDAQTEAKPTAEDVQAAHQRDLRNQQQVRDLSEEVQRKLAGQQTEVGNPPAGSQLAPVREPTPRDPQVLEAIGNDQCRGAQNFLAAVREKTWIGMTDDQMKRIYGWVTDQCRVKTTPND